MKLRSLLLFTLISIIWNTSSAHEPLYGIGPHVLFKGGLAPHITFDWFGNIVNTELALGYGITKNWTVIGEISYQGINGNYTYQGFHFKQKYRFYSRFKPGVLQQISAVVKLSIPSASNQPTVANVGLSGGQEALRWYWFFSGSYAMKFNDQDYVPGNEIKYSATIGYRPNKTNYYKPDLVIFLEGIGKYYEKATLNEKRVINSSGHSWSLAPTFMLTHRNLALRGGVNFNIYSISYINEEKLNYKAILEYHF